MDVPIRRYVRLQEQGSSTRNPATKRTGRRKPKKPFQAEWSSLPGQFQSDTGIRGHNGTTHR